MSTNVQQMPELLTVLPINGHSTVRIGSAHPIRASRKAHLVNGGDARLAKPDILITAYSSR